MGGQVLFFSSNGSSVVGIIQGGKLRKGHCPHRQGPAGKACPTFRSASDTLPGFEAYEWNGVFVPRGTPAGHHPHPQRRDQRSAPRTRRQRSASRLDQHRESPPTTPEEFRAFVKDQMERWGKVVKEANIKLG